ncbi:PhzF family phenazine biosynthesis protein [Frankia nepalensis]|uniref:PhzF family phenazine biosynthesis protein n=1 Tax=Frankia nepalensis TaxID=1836974 RepID=UPI002889D6B4|nr:PhzF family phenazine biosynthesis isomerase [Frankia nepalensis]
MKVITVAACLRRGGGGSPTAVVLDGHGLGDAELARIPAQAGTSHVAVVDPRPRPGGHHAVRFFTATGELPACGHGTVAAITVLALQDPGKDFSGLLRVAGRDFEAAGRITTGSAGDVVEARFDQGLVAHRAATALERDAFLAALGLDPGALGADDDICVASPGRERVLVPVLDRAILAGLRPDLERLAAESHRHGQLGCFVYVPPTPTAPAAGRMFAPAIGVPEDVANANSAGCLAAHLLLTGRAPAVAVDQGDALGHPSTVHATATRTPAGVTTTVGGSARVLRHL